MKFRFFCKQCDKDIVVSDSYIDVQATMSRHGKTEMHGGMIYMDAKLVMDNTAFVEMARSVKEAHSEFCKGDDKALMYETSDQ